MLIDQILPLGVHFQSECVPASGMNSIDNLKISLLNFTEIFISNSDSVSLDERMDCFVGKGTDLFSVHNIYHLNSCHCFTINSSLTGWGFSTKVRDFSSCSILFRVIVSLSYSLVLLFKLVLFVLKSQIAYFNQIRTSRHFHFRSKLTRRFTVTFIHYPSFILFPCLLRVLGVVLEELRVSIS